MNSGVTTISVFFTVLLLIILPGEKLFSQVAGDDTEVVTLRKQFDVLQRRTHIYDGFRAIREEMFQEIRRQSLDSLSRALKKIEALETELEQSGSQIKQLNLELETMTGERDQAIETKDSISILGKPLKKGIYTTLLWSVIGILVVLALILLAITRNASRLSRQRAMDLSDMLQEYENYRQSSRERLERITIEHFNEIKKLKGL